MKTYREENYLKAIYQLANHDKTRPVSPTDIANWLEVKPPTVLEKLAILVKKEYVTYNKFDGAKLTPKGNEVALNIVRRHRIWETYLYKQLKFSWTEVHEIAEQLEHINSDKLIDRIYDVIGNPDFDPHGDPIPNKQGKLPKSDRRPLSQSIKGCKCVVLGVSEHSEVFLNYLTELNISLNDKLIVEQINSYDDTLKLGNKTKEAILMSSKAAQQILVQCLKPNCTCK
ncbi:MAG: metal-dependent transcriptional regulator [Bacteroidetes bacterium]|jgi:DtxR family Mn-dependent transcriptional regulator|nr:metal-dependent transcriptional regulator [Bacteroidota bacterium]MDF2451876.1 metal-dependent transcriptional regulator [Bacteroidota bacterium]